MGYYLDDERVISARTEDLRSVLRTVANRYIGQNPPFDVSFYAYNTQGIKQDSNYRFVFNFDEIYPQSRPESNIYAWSKLWSDEDAAMSFEVSCFGPVIVYCNGERVFKPNVFIERKKEVSATFTVKLKKGWNSFILHFIRTTAGCGGTLGAVSSRHRPLSFIVPSEDRAGQKGWLYTLPLTESMVLLPEIGMSEADTGFLWFPEKDWSPKQEKMSQMARMFSLQSGYHAFGWSVLHAGRNTEFFFRGRNTGSIMIYIDKEPVYRSAESGEFEFNMKLCYGKHSILVKNECGATDWGFTLECFDGEKSVSFRCPVNVRGSEEAWLYAGPFPSAVQYGPDEICTMIKPFESDGQKVYWRLDKPGMVVRPYNDSKLFGEWNYPLGVTLYGLLETGRYTDEPWYRRYVAEHVSLSTRFFEYSLWDGEQYGAASMHNLLTTIGTLDDCGSFGSLMLEAAEELPDREYVRIADYIADFIVNRLERMPDGTFFRVNRNYQLMDGTLWADDLYMSIPFLCRYYKLTGNKKYIDEAAKQIIGFHKYLYRPDKKIMSHVYDVNFGKATEVSWGRGNGWVAFSCSEILAFLPENHSLRNEILDIFSDLCEGYLALQDHEGMWHQVLTDWESYPEASCTSMFLCAFARGVRNGWLKVPGKYIRAVNKAWKGLCGTVIDQDGNVYGICRGSGFSFSADYYKNDLGWLVNDTHGTGIILLAGVEYGRMTEWLEKEK